jgi:hypothetical protein
MINALEFKGQTPTGTIFQSSQPDSNKIGIQDKRCSTENSLSCFFNIFNPLININVFSYKNYCLVLFYQYIKGKAIPELN